MSTPAGPFAAESRRGVLWLTLDTPRCKVNVFSNEAAAQLVDIVRAIDVQETRALVIASGKQDSFVNGAALLMGALAVKSPDGAAEITRDVREAYQTLSDCPVPTVAAVQGNCYGCGVELVLRADYRVAADTAVTHFYMTEINDYLFSPIFEGTLRLPLLLGLEGAAELLLWNEQWSARRAHERGLVDAVFEDTHFAQDVQHYAEETMSRWQGAKPPARAPRLNHGAGDLDLALRRARERIAALPPAYQDVYMQALELMARTAALGQIPADARRLEIELSGMTSCLPKAKSALSFFFIRQAAQQRCLGDASASPPAFGAGFGADVPNAWRSELAALKVPGAVLGAQGGSTPRATRGHALRFAGYPAPAFGAVTALEHRVAVAQGLSDLWPDWHAATALYRPLAPLGPRVIEIAVRDEAQPEDRALYAYLTRAGYRAVISRPRRAFVLTECLIAYFAPLVRYLLIGGSIGALNATLREFGFVRRPHDLLVHLDASMLSRWLATTTGERDAQIDEALRSLARSDLDVAAYDGALMDALGASLLAVAKRWLSERIVSHAPLADVVMREIVDFPLLHGSLLTYFTPARTAELCRRAENLKPLVAAQDLAVLEARGGTRQEARL